MTALPGVVLVVVVAVAAFAVAARLGILLGLRMDRALQEHADRESGSGGEVDGDD